MTECGSHDHYLQARRRKFLRRVILPIIIFIFLILFIILLTWAILQPSKPRFVLQDATLYNFNISGNPPNLLSSNIQITLIARNPNDKIGIYYDRLDVYASYQSQQITIPTSIPSTYQGHKEVNVWSPYIGGNSVPVAPYNGFYLDQDKTRGNIELLVRIDGRVRFKVGAVTTKKYNIYVRCPAFINFGNNGGSGVIVGDNPVKYTYTKTCSVSL